MAGDLGRGGSKQSVLDGVSMASHASHMSSVGSSQSSFQSHLRRMQPNLAETGSSLNAGVIQMPKAPRKRQRIKSRNTKRQGPRPNYLFIIHQLLSLYTGPPPQSPTPLRSAPSSGKTAYLSRPQSGMKLSDDLNSSRGQSRTPC